MLTLEEQLAHWVALGLIDNDQAARIRAVEAGEESPASQPDRSRSLVSEALGYVGGALVVVASLLLGGQVWEDLSDGARLALVGGASALLVGVGFGVPALPGTAGARLRSAVWALSTGAFAGFAGLLVVDTLDWQDERAAVAILGSTALQAAVLWSLSRSPVQQVTVFGPLCGAAAAGAALLSPDGEKWDVLPGIGVLLVAGTWLALALRDRIGPRVVAELLGGGGVVIGGAATQAADWGRVVSLVVLVGLVALALRLNEVLLLAVATLGMFLILPPLVTHWFPGALAAPLVLLGCGAALVLLALRAVRSKQR